MQFKHPEILWALLLLLIPIFIHLFQLRRFKKTPFTNVAMLQKVVSEARKSSQLKKWLLLFSRLALLAGLVIAFAQPFSAKTTALTPKETVIYLDNSFSMQAKKDGFSLLNGAVQELAKAIGEDSEFSLFTNDQTFRKTNFKNIQNELLALNYSHEQLDLNAIRLKANTLFATNQTTIKQLIVLSDFQNRLISEDSVTNIAEHYVVLRPDSGGNISIDSLYLNENASSQSEITVRLSSSDNESVPISLYNGENLIAKSSADFEEKNDAEVVFSIPTNKNILGRAVITDNSLTYDNTLYFNIDVQPIIQVMAITAQNSDYLQRLFPNSEFNLKVSNLNQLDYSLIDTQNLIIVDGLAQIPTSLQRALKGFHENGGSLLLIPPNTSEIDSYNTFTTGFARFRYNQFVSAPQKITDIAFDHPLYQNVFEKRIQNFQNPDVKSHFNVNSNGVPILSYQSGAPFLVGFDRFFVFTASIDAENSNFKNSPLIVPTFYNIAALSLKRTSPYFVIGNRAAIDVNASLGPDNILSLSKDDIDLIPRQQSFNNKVALYFDENIGKDGSYQIKDENQVYGTVSFNYKRNESELRYTEVENSSDDISSLFERLKAESDVTPYWKWFVILALVFALLEVLIQKFIA